jgi:hypothetical protein
MSLTAEALLHNINKALADRSQIDFTYSLQQYMKFVQGDTILTDLIYENLISSGDIADLRTANPIDMSALRAILERCGLELEIREIAGYEDEY